MPSNKEDKFCRKKQYFFIRLTERSKKKDKCFGLSTQSSAHMLDNLTFFHEAAGCVPGLHASVFPSRSQIKLCCFFQASCFLYVNMLGLLDMWLEKTGSLYCWQCMFLMCCLRSCTDCLVITLNLIFCVTYKIGIIKSHVTEEVRWAKW